jgi:hypothetical protein
MNVLDGLTKQLNGRGVAGKTILEGVVWFADLHKHLAAVGDNAAKFAAGAAGPDEVQKFLQRLHDDAKNVWAHLGNDAIALTLMSEVSAKRPPDDLGVEGAPSYMKSEAAGSAKAAAEAVDRKVAECGVRPDAWRSSGLPARIADVLDAAATVRGTLELLAGPAKLGHGELDDRFFEVHYGATGQIGNRHFQDKPNEPGLLKACQELLKKLRREMMLVKAGS